MNMIDSTLAALRDKAGVYFMGANNARVADAAPVTMPNGGIPALFTTYVDPQLIEVLVAPMKAVEIVGSEARKGDWTMDTATFAMVESTGQVAAYGDYNENGRAGVNVNFPTRQSYHYQTTTEWGERELERAGDAKIDWVNRCNIASVLTLNKFQNKSYFFGVQGVNARGLLNDPELPAAITPATKAAGGTGWTDATADEVLADVAALYAQLQRQSNGLIDRDTKMTLAMSPIADADGMTKISEYNVSVADRLAKLYPNLTVKTAPEYDTAAGGLLQLIVDEFDGQQTAVCAFTEKLRAHPIVQGASSWKQKKSQGTWGTIIFRPFLIAQMLGV